MNGRHRALLIGNSTFPEDRKNLPDLHGPVNDLKALAQALTDPLTGLFDPADVQALPNWELRPVERRLEDFFRYSGMDDVLLLYYSGHGFRDSLDQLYLSVQDTTMEYLSTALSSGRITHLHHGSAVGTLIIILDCCHSGAHKSGTLDLVEPLKGSGRYVIASCSAGRTSPDASGRDALSPFTELLVEGLAGAPAADRLTVDGLWGYLARRCHDEGLPKPQRSFAGQGTVEIARRADTKFPAEPPMGSTESRNTLLGRVDCFTGRDKELDGIVKAIRRKEAEQVSPTVVISGFGGVGKTALATMVAHELSDDDTYTYFLDLYGWTRDRKPLSTEQVLEILLSHAGLIGETPAIRAGGGQRSHQLLLGRWRDWASNRRIILVLDNVADAEQIGEILPGAPQCLTIITSRDRLSLGNINRSLGPLTDVASAHLFDRIAERDDDADHDAGEASAIRQIIQHTQGFPLAIKIHAGYVAQSGGGGAIEIAAGLSSGALNGLGPIEATFEVTYDRLNPTDRETFGRLGLFPGSTVTAFAAALLTGKTEAEARELLRRLSNSYVLELRSPGTYRLHDYLAEFAKNHAPRDEDIRGQVHDALLGGYRAAATAANRLTGHVSVRRVQESPSAPGKVSIPTTPEAAQDWLAGERDNVVALITSTNDPKVIHLAQSFGLVLLRDNHLEAARLVYEQARILANEAKDRAAHADALIGRGDVARMQNQYDTADQHYRQAADLAHQSGDQITHADALTGRGHVASMQKRYDTADQHYRQAADLAHQSGDQITHAAALNGRGDVASMQNQYDDADQHYRQAADLAHQSGDQITHAYALIGRGHVARLQKRYDDADQHYRQAADLAHQSGDQITHAAALNGRGDVARMQNQYDDADQHYQQATDLAHRSGDRINHAYALTGRGHVARMQNQYDDADQHYQQAADLARQSGDQITLAYALYSQGWVAVARGEPERAESLFGEALRLHESAGDFLAEMVRRDLD